MCVSISSEIFDRSSIERDSIMYVRIIEDLSKKI